jgi:phenylacetate-CoA ligase
LSWATRSNLGALLDTDASSRSDSGGGLLVSAVPGEGFVPVSSSARIELRERSAATLQAAGIAAGDRAILSVNGEGDLVGPLLADAMVEVGAAAAVVGARGRMRLLGAMRALRPNVWVTTPTGALDFLARLYLEFNVDPLDLDLEQIVLVGEIASPGTARRLADEFEARVVGIYCDPVFGAALASGQNDAWSVTDPKVLGLATLDRDMDVEWKPRSDEDGHAELVLRAAWCPELSGVKLRTGQLVGFGETASLFANTVGEHLLVRGRWLSIPLLRRALGVIDGIAAWRLVVARGDGTLDKLTVSLAFERPSLVENPMWAKRAREAIASIAPVAFELETEVADEGALAESIDDQRGHHLGIDRAAVGRTQGR